MTDIFISRLAACTLRYLELKPNFKEQLRTSYLPVLSGGVLVMMSFTRAGVVGVGNEGFPGNRV